MNCKKIRNLQYVKKDSTIKTFFIANVVQSFLGCFLSKIMLEKNKNLIKNMFALFDIIQYNEKVIKFIC